MLARVFLCFADCSFRALTIYLVMGFFRFIDGRKGLHMKPFLQIDYNTVGWTYGPSGVVLTFDRLPAERGTRGSWHISNRRSRSICGTRLTRTLANLEKDVRSRQSARMIISYMFSIGPRTKPCTKYEGNFWLERTARPASLGRSTWNHEES